MIAYSWSCAWFCHLKAFNDGFILIDDWLMNWSEIAATVNGNISLLSLSLSFRRLSIYIHVDINGRARRGLDVKSWRRLESMLDYLCHWWHNSISVSLQMIFQIYSSFKSIICLCEDKSGTTCYRRLHCPLLHKLRNIIQEPSLSSIGGNYLLWA